MACYYGRPAVELTDTELAHFGVAAGLITLLPDEGDSDGATRIYRT